MKLSDFPKKLIAHYNLHEKTTTDGFVYVSIKLGMYGLTQIGILSQTLLEKCLNPQGYHQIWFMPVLWTHEWQPICFTLVVDHFGVNYVGKDYADNLIKCIK